MTVGVLEDEPDGGVPAEPVDGPDPAPFGMGQVGLDVAVGQGGVNQVADDLAARQGELRGDNEP